MPQFLADDIQKRGREICQVYGDRADHLGALIASQAIWRARQSCGNLAKNQVIGLPKGNDIINMIVGKREPESDITLF